MTTGKEPHEVTSICSTGLEPDNGPTPIPAPRVHTLCLPCLKDFDNHHMKSPNTSVSEEAELYKSPLTFPCPTCRAVNTEPLGGVNLSQKYYDRLICNQHDQQLPCQSSLINFCLNSDCERLVEHQLKLLEAVLVATRDDKDRLQRERRVISDLISRRADALRVLVTEAEERTQRALAEIANRLGNQMQEVMDTIRDKHYIICQLSSQGATTEQVTIVSSDGQTILLSDDEFQYYQKRCNRSRERKILVHQFKDCAIDLRAVEAFIGTVSDDKESARENVHSSASTFVCSKPNDAERPESVVSISFQGTTKLAAGMTDIKHKLGILQPLVESASQNDAGLDTDNVQRENSTTNLEVLKKEETRFQHSFPTFQQTLKDITEIKKDMAALRQEFELIKADNSRMQGSGDAHPDFSVISSICEDINSVQQELTLIQNVSNNIQKESSFIKKENLRNQMRIEDLSKECKGFKERASIIVAFNAEINQDIMINNSLFDPVILNIVTCNAGQAYNEHTGVFTAPVTGIYFFLARAMATQGPGYCHLLITVDGDDVASSLSHEGELHAGVGCTVHVVHGLTRGQKVALLAKGEARLRCYETSFSGALLRPE